MFQKNYILHGLIIGLLLPAVLFVMLYQVFELLELRGLASGEGLSESFRIRTLALIAIAANILPMQAYRKRRFEAAMRGIVIAVGVYALAWVLYFGPSLMQ